MDSHAELAPCLREMYGLNLLAGMRQAWDKLDITGAQNRYWRFTLDFSG